MLCKNKNRTFIWMFFVAACFSRSAIGGGHSGEPITAVAGLLLLKTLSFRNDAQLFPEKNTQRLLRIHPAHSAPEYTTVVAKGSGHRIDWEHSSNINLLGEVATLDEEHFLLSVSRFAVLAITHPQTDYGVLLLTGSPLLFEPVPPEERFRPHRLNLKDYQSRFRQCTPQLSKLQPGLVFPNNSPTIVINQDDNGYLVTIIFYIDDKGNVCQSTVELHIHKHQQQAKELLKQLSYYHNVINLMEKTDKPALLRSEPKPNTTMQSVSGHIRDYSDRATVSIATDRPGRPEMKKVYSGKVPGINQAMNRPIKRDPALSYSYRWTSVYPSSPAQTNSAPKQTSAPSQSSLRHESTAGKKKKREQIPPKKKAKEAVTPPDKPPATAPGHPSRARKAIRDELQLDEWLEQQLTISSEQRTRQPSHTPLSAPGPAPELSTDNSSPSPEPVVTEAGIPIDPSQTTILLSESEEDSSSFSPPNSAQAHRAHRKNIKRREAKQRKKKERAAGAPTEINIIWQDDELKGWSEVRDGGSLHFAGKRKLLKLMRDNGRSFAEVERAIKEIINNPGRYDFKEGDAQKMLELLAKLFPKQTANIQSWME